MNEPVSSMRPANGPADHPIADTLAATLAHDVAIEHPPDRRPVTRDAHPKAHGCVRATFTVVQSLRNEFSHGVFIAGKKYQSWIRFSNALKIRHDLVRDARGMAIKLVGVEGENVTPWSTSQDFLLVTHPAFFVSNAEQYVDFPAAVFKVTPIISFNFRLMRFFFGVSPPRFRWRGAWALMRSLKWTSSPLVLSYFSQVPLSMGPGRAAKFRVVPKQGPGIRGGFCFFLKVLVSFIPWIGKLVSRRWENLLRDRLRSSLESKGASFDFEVQLCREGTGTPIDDATVPWRSRLSPFVKVARIDIAPGQKPDTTEMLAFAEHLAYSPWHALPDHRPLGSINEVRRVVYDRIAVFRHRANRLILRDPALDESPAEYLRSISCR